MSVSRGYLARALPALLALAPLLAAPARADQPQPRRRVLPRMVADFARIERLSGGVLGVSALDLDSGERVSYRGDARFPMASTYKLPIALTVLDQVAGGERLLEDEIRLEPVERVPGPGPVTAALEHGPVTVTLDSLVADMIQHSDNSASDALLRVAGGTAAVRTRVRQLGIRDLRVNRTEAQLGADARRDSAAFARDRRDTTTPLAMVDLIAALARGKALDASLTLRLEQMLERTSTGAGRLRAGLPEGARLMHKTGTLDGVANDVGLVILPGGPRIAIAVFVARSDAPLERRERAIAEAARMVLALYRARDTGAAE